MQNNRYDKYAFEKSSEVLALATVDSEEKATMMADTVGHNIPVWKTYLLLLF